MLCLMYYLSIKQFLENVVFKLNDCCWHLICQMTAVFYINWEIITLILYS